MRRVSNHSEENFRMLVSSILDYAIITLDTDGNVVTWNEGAQRLKGYSLKDIVGKNFSCFYPKEDVAAGKPKFALKEAQRAGKFEDFGWRIRQDGSRFYANVVITVNGAIKARKYGEVRLTSS